MQQFTTADGLTQQQQRLVTEHMWLVDLHLRRKVQGLGRASSDRSRDDLFQEGCLGLIEAVKRHDPATGVPFVAYALPRIHTAVSRALWRGASMIRAPRRLRHAHAGSGEGATVPRAVSLEHDPQDFAGELTAGEEDGAAETVGQRLRTKYERIVHRAVELLSRGKSRRGDRRALLERLASHRLLVPQEEHRTALREIARQTDSSVARVVQAEQQLRGCIGKMLSRDPVTTRLREEARRRSLGMAAPIDATLHWELRELAESRYVDAFRRVTPEQRNEMVTRLLECSGGNLSGLVQTLFGSLPRDQQDVLLSEIRLAG